MATEWRSVFDYKTKTSLNLPQDWQPVETSDDTVMYAATSEPEHNPNLIIKVLRLQPVEADSYAKLGRTNAELPRPGYTRIKLGETEVDNRPALLHLYTWHNGETAVFQLQAFVQLDEYVFIFTYTSLKNLKFKYQPVFEQSLRSVRFVPVD